MNDSIRRPLSPSSGCTRLLTTCSGEKAREPDSATVMAPPVQQQTQSRAQDSAEAQASSWQLQFPSANAPQSTNATRKHTAKILFRR